MDNKLPTTGPELKKLREAANVSAALVVIFDDIITHFDAYCNKWHTHKASRAEHVDDDNMHYARLRAFQDELVKEAASQNQITIAEIEEDTRTSEVEHPGM
jgi:hypothetical protein